MSQAHFGREGLGAIEVVHLLPRSSLEPKAVSALGSVAQVEGIAPVVVEVVEAFDLILNPALSLQRLTHVSVLADYDEYFGVV